MQENKEAVEYILSVVDEAERAVLSDPLAESIPFMSYECVMKDNSPDRNDCRECPLWVGRAGAEEYINFADPKVLSIIGYTERGESILQRDAMTMYENQMVKVLGLQRSARALTSLIKCPTDHFDHECADKCRPLLKKEMEKMKPEVMILFGTDIARYMLRTTLPFDSIRASRRPWMINHIRTYVTYSQRECLMNPSLKAQVFEDLKAIKAALS